MSQKNCFEFCLLTQKFEGERERERKREKERMLAGKRCVVSGATSGIGMAVAKHFVKEGARVAATGRNQVIFCGFSFLEGIAGSFFLYLFLYLFRRKNSFLSLSFIFLFSHSCFTNKDVLHELQKELGSNCSIIVGDISKDGEPQKVLFSLFLFTLSLSLLLTLL